MPLKLQPPRPGKTRNYAIRGTHYGIFVDETAGTPDRANAQKRLVKIRKDIERGAYTPKGSLTFADAADAYLDAGHSKLYLLPIAKHFREVAVKDIDQAAIDKCAAALYPGASPATRNRQVYTPISAILKHNNIDFTVKRPKGGEGEVRVVWLWPEELEALIREATKIDPEFGAFVTVFPYTGARLSEVLRTKCDDVRLDEAFAYIGRTKNGEPRPLHLPPIVVAALANHPRGLDRPGETLFPYRKGRKLYRMLHAALDRAGVSLPPRTAFHAFRHTFGTWMRRYAGLDTKGLVSTGVWKDEKSAARYQHVIVSEEARRADMLPTPKPAANKP